MQPFILSTIVLVLSSGAVAAQQPNDALDGLDPVLLVGGKEVPGKSALSVTRGDFVYLFSTADTKAAFERDPARYEIQLGGLCAKMGRTAGGNPADFIVHDGKIYIFGTDDCHKQFQAAPSKYLETPAAPLPASSDAATRGRQLIDLAVTALGGAARLDALTSYVESFSRVQTRPQGEATLTTRTIWSLPDRVRQERTVALQGKTMTSATVLTPAAMWFLSAQGQAYPMRPASRPSLERDFGRHPVALLRARRSAGFKAVAIGTDVVDGVKLESVRVISGATDVTLALETTGRIRSATYRDRNAEGEYGTITVLYSDYRAVEGLQLPFTTRATFNGQPDAPQSVTLDTISLNAPLDASLFAPKTPAGR